ncbi:MAG: CDP-alcohol phosphatidyltransferase family protein [Planctomycetota bacterium]
MAKFAKRHVTRALAYSVHLYTASNAVWAFLATVAVFQGDDRWAFFYMTLAVIIDATDGPLARKINIKQVLPHIDGRKLDDIVDYLVYTFVPILLIWHSGWLPEPSLFWIAFPVVASLFTFANTGAKEDDEGFFLGFPSYWNIFAFYIGLTFRFYGQEVVLALTLALSVLSVMPVRFVYPNKATRWKPFFIGGCVLWLLQLAPMMVLYPEVPLWLLWSSCVYPALYLVLSMYLDVTSRLAESELELSVEPEPISDA